MKMATQNLHSLGIERETAEQERRLLLDIVAAFQEITQEVLSTNYGVRNNFDRDERLKLGTLVASRNATFASDCGSRHGPFGHGRSTGTERLEILAEGLAEFPMEEEPSRQSDY